MFTGIQRGLKPKPVLAPNALGSGSPPLKKILELLIEYLLVRRNALFGKFLMSYSAKKIDYGLNLIWREVCRLGWDGVGASA